MFKKFTLQKQLAIIFSIIAILIVAILIPIIDHNLKIIVDRQMYNALEKSLSFYSVEDKNKPITDSKKDIIVMVYYVEENELYTSHMFAQEAIEMAKQVFLTNLDKLIENGDVGPFNSKGKYNGETIYYQIRSNQDGIYIISLMPSDYSDSLLSSFRQEIVYIFYIALVVLALVLFAWLNSLIRPLKMIREYIDGIKENQESKLIVNRSDEIGVVAKELVDMKEQLDQQNKIKEEMIHNISHDLKTPIALIKTYSQSIKDGIYPYGDKDSSMDIIIENAERLDDKVKGLLHLNRLDFLSNQENNENVSMKELIEHVCLQVEPMHPDIKIELNLDDVLFNGDKEHWRICIENIIDNAYRYINNKLIITLKDNYLEIYNDGEAIDINHIETLFKPYEKGTKGQFGLGLAIVYKTVTLYGYSVKAENKDDGVSFIIKK